MKEESPALSLEEAEVINWNTCYSHQSNSIHWGEESIILQLLNLTLTCILRLILCFSNPEVEYVLLEKVLSSAIVIEQEQYLSRLQCACY